MAAAWTVVDDVRERIAEGVNFTDQDLIDTIAADGSLESRADAEESLRILANGILITEKEITDNLEPATLKQFNKIRGYVNLGLSLQWVIWIVVLLVLAVIAFIAGNTWADKLRWGWRHSCDQRGDLIR